MQFNSYEIFLTYLSKQFLKSVKTESCLNVQKRDVNNKKKTVYSILLTQSKKAKNDIWKQTKTKVQINMK